MQGENACNLSRTVKNRHKWLCLDRNRPVQEQAAFEGRLSAAKNNGQECRVNVLEGAALRPLRKAGKRGNDGENGA